MAVEIKLSDLILHDSARGRVQTNPAKVKEYADLMRDGVVFPPGQAFRDSDGRLFLGHGFHRHAARRMAGFETMLVTIEDGGLDAAQYCSWGANAKNGQSLTREDKQKIVDAMLTHPEHGKLGRRAISRHTGTSHGFVSDRFRKLEALKAAQETGNVTTSEGEPSYPKPARMQPATTVPADDKEELDEQALALLMETAAASDPVQVEQLGIIPFENQLEVAGLVFKGKAQDVAAAWSKVQARLDADEKADQQLEQQRQAPGSLAKIWESGTDTPEAWALRVLAGLDAGQRQALAAKLKQDPDTRTRELMTSSKTVEHGTPQDLFDLLHQEFGFALDVCATPENAKCAIYFTAEQDGLAQDWLTPGPGNSAVWMNPPYGLGIEKWLEKAFWTAFHGRTVVCLPPAETHRAWWHKWCALGQVRLLDGALTFDGSDNTAPFANAVVVFPGNIRDPKYRPSVTHWDWKNKMEKRYKRGGGLEETKTYLKAGSWNRIGNALFCHLRDFSKGVSDAPLIWERRLLPEQMRREF